MADRGKHEQLHKREKVSVEILDFISPDANRKSLFITGIPYMTEEELIELLHSSFSKYGLLYGTQVFPYTPRLQPPSPTLKDGQGASNQTGYYAFVNFYLAMSARRAKDDLNGKVNFKGTECKITFAKRKKEATEKKTLHFSKCQEVANKFLGFNGWSVSLKCTDSETNATEEHTYKVREVCVVRLDLKTDGLHAEGLGAWEEIYCTNDPTSRGKAVCKCKKLAYQRAVENAFSKVIIVVLSNGKVAVEVDTTQPELLLTEKVLDDENVLKINEIDTDTLMFEDDDVTLSEVPEEDIDAANLHILHELEEV